MRRTACQKNIILKFLTSFPQKKRDLIRTIVEEAVAKELHKNTVGPALLSHFNLPLGYL